MTRLITTRWTSWFLCIVLSLTSLLFGDVTHDNGRIDTVTLYRNQARVVRTINVPASPDVQYIRVPDLPSGFIRGSEMVESGSETTVRSIQVVQQTDQQLDDSVADIESKYASLTTKLKAVQHNLAVIEQDLLTLDKLVDFSSGKIRENMDRATLDVNSVVTLTDFTMKKRRELANQLHETTTEIESLTVAIATNRQHRSNLTDQRKRIEYEVVIAVQSNAESTIRLVYRVTGVQWRPSYSIRARKKEATNQFVVRFDGVVVQQSGENWNNVALTFATAEPDTQTAGPRLMPLRIKASGESESSTPFDNSVSPSSATSFASLQRWQDRRLWQRDVGLNSMASANQILEIQKPSQVQREVAQDAGSDISDEAYRVPGRIDIASGTSSQTLTIASDTLEGELYYNVTPLLSSFAFREAAIKNSLDRNLIAGVAKVYIDDKYVGETTIPPTTEGQTLLVGFGPDRQIRTRRELLLREETIRGGNRRTDVRYRLVVSNYHDAIVSVRLIDRIPVTSADGSVSISLASDANEILSADPLYLRMQRPTGVLRWDLEIPKHRFGSEAYDFDYQFSLEHDRHRTIVAENLVRNIRKDYRFEKSNGGGGFGGGSGAVE